MERFRALRGFQIIVFTCRPGDYLAPSAMMEEGGAGFVDSEEGFVRAIDLGRAVGGAYALEESYAVDVAYPKNSLWGERASFQC